MSLLLYGIVRSEHPTSRLGATRDDIVTVQHNGLEVVARGGLESDTLDDTDALDYVDVLIEVVRDGPVLPFLYGTIAPDTDAIRTDILVPSLGTHLRMLSSIEDLVEVRIELAFDREVAATDGFGAWVEQRAESALSPLRDIALRSVRLHPPADGVERSGQLVPRERMPEFDATVASIRRSLRGEAQLTYLGPMPLFDFLDVDAERMHFVRSGG